MSSSPGLPNPPAVMAEAPLRLPDGDVLTLRAIGPGDGGALAAVRGHPEVAHWYVSAEADQSQTPAVDYALMAHQKAAHWAAHGFGQWLVWDGPRAVARGGLHLLALNGRYEADVGFAVLPEAQGRGVASALGLAACDLASAIGLREVAAAVRVDNRRAGWIAESIGFVPEAEIERFGHPYVLYRRPIT